MRMKLLKNWKFWAGILILLSLLFLLNQNRKASINSFEECAKIYPVMESYPRKCAVPGGDLFIEDISDDDMAICTMEAKECPDGSWVGRTGPNCKFTSCP